MHFSVAENQVCADVAIAPCSECTARTKAGAGHIIKGLSQPLRAELLIKARDISCWLSAVTTARPASPTKSTLEF